MTMSHHCRRTAPWESGRLQIAPRRMKIFVRVDYPTRLTPSVFFGWSWQRHRPHSPCLGLQKSSPLDSLQCSQTHQWGTELPADRKAKVGGTKKWSVNNPNVMHRMQQEFLVEGKWTIIPYDPPHTMNCTVNERKKHNGGDSPNNLPCIWWVAVC